MRIAYWTPKATNTPSEYVMLIAFPLQQWLQQGTTILRYTYIACIVKYIGKAIYQLNFYCNCCHFKAISSEYSIESQAVCSVR